MNPFHRQLLTTFARNLAVVLLVLVPIALVIGVTAPTVMPLALLIATLVTVGDLARYGEITALQAAGWSPLRVFLPLIAIGLAGSVTISILKPAGAIDLAARSGTPGPAALTALHGARASTLGCLLAVLTGLPLAATMRRRDTFVGFGAALGIHFLYQIATAVAFAYGRHGMLPPVLAGWAGTGLLAVVIALLWRRLGR